MRAVLTALLPLVMVACGGGDDAAPAAPASQLADVAVTVDGERIGLTGACQTADGAVVATATTGRRIVLVREQGPALRLSTEGGTSAETTDVSTAQIGVSEVHEGSVSVEGQPTPVVFEVRTDITLPTCEAVPE